MTPCPKPVRERKPQEDKKELFAYYWRIVVGTYRMYQTEYNFDPPRKHRFDFAWPDKKIAVEVDGNAWHVKGGGKHGTDKDREKINIAASMGWRVFHFSPAMLDKNPGECIEMIVSVLTERILQMATNVHLEIDSIDFSNGAFSFEISFFWNDKSRHAVGTCPDIEQAFDEAMAYLERTCAPAAG